MALHQEIAFETDICNHLAQHGWLYGAPGAEGDASDLEAEGRNLRFDRVERYLHADHAEYGVFRHLVAEDAILAEVVLGCLGRVDDMQERTAIRRLDRHVGRAGGHDLLFHAVQFARTLGVRAVQLRNRLAAGDMQVLDDRQLLDLVEKYFALANGAGDHHAGQSGHGHFVDALREVLRLTNCGFPIDLGGPYDGTGPDERQNNPDGSGQTNPDLQISDARHLVVSSTMPPCQVRRSGQFAGLCQPRHSPAKLFRNCESGPKADWHYS